MVSAVVLVPVLQEEAVIMHKLMAVEVLAGHAGMSPPITNIE